MRFGHISGQVAALGLAIAVIAPFGTHSAEARSRHSSAVHANVRAMQAGISGARHAGRGYTPFRYSSSGRLQCVPFARENTGIELSGNAGTWWDHAEGVYARGAKPEVGSVLNFRANGRMRMGHVAVVSNVIDARNVQIDHANWSGPGASRGGVSRDITVVDVSPSNDWTAVRVALGHTSEFGSIYPTYGFIYDRPDQGTMVANTAATNSPAPVLNAPPRDLRPAAERLQIAATTQEVEEVAEAEDDVQPRSTGRRGTRHIRHMAGRAAGRATVIRVHATSGAVTHSRHHHRT